MTDDPHDQLPITDPTELGRIAGFALVRETPVASVLDAMRADASSEAELLTRLFGALVRVPPTALPEAVDRAMRALTVGTLTVLWRQRAPTVPGTVGVSFRRALGRFAHEVAAMADARRAAAGDAVEIHLLRGVRVKTVLELARLMRLAISARAQQEFWQYGTFTVGQWLTKSGAGAPSLDARRILGGVESAWIQASKQAEPLRAARQAAREGYGGPARDTVRALLRLLAAQQGVPTPLEVSRQGACERGLTYVESAHRFDAHVGDSCPAWGWCDVVSVRLDDTSAPSVSCSRGDEPCSGKRLALELALDALVDPELPVANGAMLRADSGVAGDARLLARLDQAIARARASQHDEEGRVGWVVTPGERLELVRISARKVGGGFKTKKFARNEGRRALTRPAHVAALAQLGGMTDRKTGDENEFDACVVPALVILAGDPDVYVKTGNDLRPLAVLLAEPRLATRTETGPTGEAVRLVLQLGDATFDRPPEFVGSWLVAFDVPNGRVTIGHVPAALAEAAEVLMRGQPVAIGPEARGRFAEAMLRLARVVPVVPDRLWLGTRIDEAPTWVLKLEWSGTASERGLQATLGLRLGEGVGILVPGEGDRIVPRQRIKPDGAIEVGHTERDPVAEVQAASALAARFGVSVPGNVAAYAWHIRALDAALAFVASAHQLAITDRLEVVWASKPLALVRGAKPDRLKLRLGFRRDWLDVAGGFTLDGHELPLAQLLGALRDGKRFVPLDDTRFLELGDELRRALAPLASLVRTRGDTLTASPLAAPLVAELAREGVTIDGPPEWLAFSDRMRAATELEPVLPLTLEATLRPYQHAGFAWAMRLAHWAPGACLADDMGLGKTLQALAVLLSRAPLGPQLVVAPTSVVPNWVREAARFAPTLDVRRAFLGAALEDALAGLGAGQVLVTSWDLLTRHEARLTRPNGDAAASLAKSASRSSRAKWATVVLDEAHAIKNPATKRAQVARGLEAGFILALTGTPVENRPLELWSLFSVVAPGLLGSAESFREAFARPIEERVPDAPQALARLVRPFLLRRTKALVAPDLPARTEVRVDVILDPVERARYEQIRKSALRQLADAGPEALSGQTGMIRVLAVLTRLRQVACHPQLVDPKAPPTSAKLERLMELALELRGEGRRMLVFSQFTELLALVRAAFDAAQITYVYLDGSTPGPAREIAVDTFQRGQVDAFILSLKAGGVGLNLTAATEVIHLDPWWNPAVEDQASDRAHRIGQDRPVTIYRLVANGTIEEQILGLHADKRTMVASLLEGTASTRPLGADELLRLLGGDLPDPTA